MGTPGGGRFSHAAPFTKTFRSSSIELLRHGLAISTEASQLVTLRDYLDLEVGCVSTWVEGSVLRLFHYLK